ncbi:MAG TPA: hypothetical protein VK215_15955 [Acidimicrobiales bacterium]|nr:hypothetical protein [Acidimicrobiales bacterium]HLN43952.1 hypothetical protein [Acidimicrobiales bacterium]
MTAGSWVVSGVERWDYTRRSRRSVVLGRWTLAPSHLGLQNHLMPGDLVEVLWRRFGQHVFLIYAEGEPEHLNGDLSFAAATAWDAGLGIVESSPAMALWVKDPGFP